jgi:hypothetical protein
VLLLVWQEGASLRPGQDPRDLELGEGEGPGEGSAVQVAGA